METQQLTGKLQNENGSPFNKSPARTKPSGAVSLGGGAQTPRGKKGTLVLRVVGAAGHNARMLPTYDFKLALTRVIELTGGPGAELATLQDAARFIGQMKPWRQARDRIGTLRPSCC